MFVAAIPPLHSGCGETPLLDELHCKTWGQNKPQSLQVAMASEGLAKWVSPKSYSHWKDLFVSPWTVCSWLDEDTTPTTNSRPLLLSAIFWRVSLRLIWAGGMITTTDTFCDMHMGMSFWILLNSINCQMESRCLFTHLSDWEQHYN